MDLLKNQGKGKEDDVDEDVWWSYPEMENVYNVYVKILESSKLFLETESWDSVNEGKVSARNLCVSSRMAAIKQLH